MGIRDRLGRLTGKTKAGPGRRELSQGAASRQETLDLARYRYLLRVAMPELLEQVHGEAFAELPLELRERLFLRLRHDLSEGQGPASVDPTDLARAAVAAQGDDHGYLVRMLRRPGQGVTEGHFVSDGSDRSGGLLFAGSVLGRVAAMVVRSDAAAEALVAFNNSPEAAQVDASVFVRPPGPMGHSAWEAGAGGVAGAGSGPSDGGGAGAI